MSEPIAETRVPRRGIFGWMMFDWAAQPFFTVVITFIFGPYFVSQMASDPDLGVGTGGKLVTGSPRGCEPARGLGRDQGDRS